MSRSGIKNSSPLGEGKKRLYWSHAQISSWCATKTDLKVHLIWILKYRKLVLTGDIAIRVHDLIWQIAMEHEDY